ncbi:zeta-sarcoglycan isoform X1 [Vespula maculifrons]|uniref:Zeta-sarcoglycan isoform X1 n=1 Tax=Vespula maculifrons TaxID=7453 RepID=A0ABD2CUP4_VESMC
MDTSPTLSIGGSRARAALLTTSGTGSGGTDRRVVFLTSQTVDGSGHETKTWPHHWSPHTVQEIQKILRIEFYDNEEYSKANAWTDARIRTSKRSGFN